MPVKKIVMATKRPRKKLEALPLRGAGLGDLDQSRKIKRDRVPGGPGDGGKSGPCSFLLLYFMTSSIPYWYMTCNI